MNKFEKQLALCTIVIYENLVIQRNVLDKLTENGGVVKPSLKAKLTRNINQMQKMYDNYNKQKVCKQQDADRLVKSIYEYTELRNIKNKSEQAFDFESEKKLLPPNFLDSITTAITVFEYSYEKLKKTLEDTSYLAVFDKMKCSLKKYTDFIIDEVILYVFMIRDLRDWKDKVLAGELYHNRDRNLDEVFYYYVNGKFTFRVARKNKTIFKCEKTKLDKLEVEVNKYYKDNNLVVEGLGWK